MTDKAISPLRRRMIEDMTIRKLAPKTQASYIRAVRNFTIFLGRSPDRAGAGLEGLGERRHDLASRAGRLGLPRHGVSECGVHIGEGDSGVREELPRELADLAPALRLGCLTGQFRPVQERGRISEHVERRAPRLLADPQEGHNVLYACGYPSKKPPRSIAIKATLVRCSVVVPEFTNDDIKFCAELFERRNSELHSGDVAFSNYPTQSWLPDFLRITNILVKFQDKSLEDLLGAEEAEVAQRTLSAMVAGLKDEVKEMVRSAKAEYEALATKKKLALQHSRVRKVSCPSCKAGAIVVGEIARHLEPKVGEDGILDRITLIPTGFACMCCGLRLESYDRLYAAGYGEQFTVEEWEDPKDYYGIEFEPGVDFDPYDYIDPPDYQNE